MPGAEGSLLLLLPARSCSNAFSPGALLLPSAPEPQTPTPCPWSGSQQWAGSQLWQAPRSCSAAALLPRSPGCSRSRAGGAAAAPGDPGHRHPFSWDRPSPAGAAGHAKGRGVCASTPLGAGQGCKGLQSPAEVPARSQEGQRDRAGSQLSPEATIPSCASSVTCSSSWSEAAASALLPSPLSSSTHKVPSSPEELWLQPPHKSLVTENIY